MKTAQTDAAIRAVRRERGVKRTNDAVPGSRLRGPGEEPGRPKPGTRNPLLGAALGGAGARRTLLGRGLGCGLGALGLRSRRLPGRPGRGLPAFLPLAAFGLLLADGLA